MPWKRAWPTSRKQAEQGRQLSTPTATAAGTSGVTAICCLAFMANGELPGRGEYGHVVQKGLDYVLANAQESGLIASENVSHGPMYGHGFATLFLGEIYGMSKDDDVRDALVKAVRLIIKSQNREGGWRYQPVPLRGGPVGHDLPDQGAALGAAGRDRRAQGNDRRRDPVRQGLPEPLRRRVPLHDRRRQQRVPAQRIGRRLALLRRRLQGRRDQRRPEVPRSAHQVRRTTAAGTSSTATTTAAQAMFIAGGKHWAALLPQHPRPSDRATRAPTAAWDSAHGGDYATGMSLIILQMPYRLLPIFQR